MEEMKTCQRERLAAETTADKHQIETTEQSVVPHVVSHSQLSVCLSFAVNMGSLSGVVSAANLALTGTDLLLPLFQQCSIQPKM